jgi:hypothetical protein
MKKYRILYRMTEQPNSPAVRSEEYEADTWRVDSDLVCLYRKERDGHEERVFEIPKSRIMRVFEVA